ncbi:MAG TPA: cobalt ECF transporter T component CbiQ [Syntrophomonadaceae bacterium]|nr:cobalt ECF transporter T component CbiQ [Syntrophomonadaceae bacterium]
MKNADSDPHTEFKPGRRRNNFIRISLQKLQNSLNEQILTERYARYPGILQGLNPAAKVLAAVGLIILAGLSRSWAALAGLWLLSLLLMKYSKLPVRVLQLRIWSFIPAITLLLSIPGMFNIINDGTPLLFLYKTGPFRFWGITLPGSLFISRQGTVAALFLFLRTGISLSMGVLLIATTSASSLFRSLHSLKIPDLFVMIIDMSYRYLGLLINISVELFEARKLRTVGYMNGKNQRAFIGFSIAALFNRSMMLAEEVYQAMAARCYTGEKPNKAEVLN